MSVNNPAGKVVALSGEVIAQSPGGERILQLDGPVFQGDTLITEQGERLEILFNDGTRLSQGEESRLEIDNFIYDQSDNSSILLDAVQGTFRTITGKIADENPENFTIQTPLATLGIRGTTVVSRIEPGHELHGPEHIEEGKTFVLTDKMGNIRFITDHSPVKVVDLYPGQPAGFPRMATPSEIEHFLKDTPFLPTLPGADDAGKDGGLEGGEDPFGPDSDPDDPEFHGMNPGDHLFGPRGSQLFKYQAGKFGPTVRAGGKETGGDEPSSPQPPLSYDEPTVLPSPQAEDMSGMLAEDGIFHGFLPGNDYGITLSYLSKYNNAGIVYHTLVAPEHGTLVINPDGTYTYTPEANYHGPDSFIYQIIDSQGGISNGTVQFSITSVNDVPIARDNGYETANDTPVTGQLEAFDPDTSDPLTYDIATAPTHGSVVINPDGSFTYTPETGFIGQDTFWFFVTDSNGAVDTGSITVAVGRVLIMGTPGFDNLVGTNANEEIWGLATGDSLNGGGGNDLLIGGDGGDTMTGGTGSDIFKYLNAANVNEVNDLITDFQTGIDSILLEGITGTPIVTLSGSTGPSNSAGGDRVILYYNTIISGFSVIYDAAGTASAFHTIAAITGGAPIVTGDIVIA